MTVRLVGTLVALGLVASPSSAAPATALVAFASSAAVHVVGADGSGLRTIWSRDCPPSPDPTARCLRPAGPVAWSPDRARVAFVHAGRLIVAGSDGSASRVVAVARQGNPELSRDPWAPDGSRLSFAADGEVHVVDIGGGAPRPITAGARTIDPPSWSAVGFDLVYGGLEPPGVFVVDARGGSPRRVSPGSGENRRWPSWSPDGRRIAFSSWVGNFPPAKLQVVEADGSGLRELTSIAAESPVWSPDGRTIAFSTGANSTRVGGVWDRDLYSVRTDGSALLRLSHSSERQIRDTEPAWSSDAARLAFTSERPRPGFQSRWETSVYTMNADGTCEARLSPAELTDDEGFLGSEASWAPASAPGERRCSDAVTRFRVVDQRPTSAVLAADVINDGTEPVEGATAVFMPGPGVVLVRARAAAAPCARTGVTMTCAVPRLDRGERAELTVEAIVRRVTQRRGRYVNVSAAAVVRLPDDVAPGTNRDGLEFFVPHCTTRIAGSGVVYGTADRDRLCGRLGDDRLWGFLGADRLDGGAGADVLRGGWDRDVLLGGAGADRIFARDGERDRIDCGRGRDYVRADRADRVAPTCERVVRR